jgi:hypothetical protein
MAITLLSETKVYFNLPKTKDPLVPPKPKELEIATSIFISRAVCGT